METNISLPSCLICGVDNCPKVRGTQSQRTNLLCRHMHIIFLLRKVLEVPLDMVISYLGSSPNVESWISVCDKCDQMVNKCKQIYDEILSAQEEFGIVKQEIIETLKESPVVKLEEDGEDDDDDVIDIDLQISEEIREYVYCNKYPEITNPFISGDRLARQKHFQLANVDKAKEDDGDDNLFWSDGENGIKIEDGDDEESDKEEKVLPFLVIKNPVATSTNTTTTTTADVEVSPSDDDENDEQLVDLDEQEELILESVGTGVNLEDPLSLPMTIELLDSDIEDQDDEDSGEKGKLIENEKPPKKKSSKRRPRTTGIKSYPKPILNMKHDDDDVETFSCPICQRKYASWVECNGHIRHLHFARTKYICNLCGSTTDGQVKLQKHQKICTGLSYPCPLAPNCLRRFFKPHSVRIHLRDTHGKGDEANLPPKIQKMLGKIRENWNSKSCETCGKTFKHPANYVRHREYIHEKKWRCGKCGVIKESKGELERHEKICDEGDLKSWICPVEECQFVFKSFRAMTIHVGGRHKGHEKIKLRKEDRPIIICEGCGATFRERNRLNNHQKWSISCRKARGLEAPPKKKKEKAEQVICQICGKGYPDRGALGCHVRRVHEKRFSKKCEICGKGCAGEGELKKHLFAVHRVGEGRRGGGVRWRDVRFCFLRR